MQAMENMDRKGISMINAHYNFRSYRLLSLKREVWGLTYEFVDVVGSGGEYDVHEAPAQGEGREYDKDGLEGLTHSHQFLKHSGVC